MDYFTGSDYRAFFGANGVRLNDNFTALIADTATGFVEAVWDGSTYARLWLVDGFSIPATRIAAAIDSSSRTDDFSVIATILAGNDTMRLSSFVDKKRDYADNDKLYGHAGRRGQQRCAGGRYRTGQIFVRIVGDINQRRFGKKLRAWCRQNPAGR